MRLQPPGTPIADPFFAAVRRRHPDIDLVMLPAGLPGLPALPPAEVGTEQVPDEVVASTLVRVATLATQLWAATVPESTERPTAVLSYGADPGSVHSLARITTRRPDGFEVLVSLRHELESRGWQVRRAPGAIERLTGVLHPSTGSGQAKLDLTASYAEASGALVFALSSGSLTVGKDRARDLVRAQAGVA